MTLGLNSISICKFWSVFCPETGNPFILLYVKLVFSRYKSLPLNIQGNNWRGLRVLDGRVGRHRKTFLKDSRITLIFTNYDTWYLGYNLTYRVHQKYFWVDRKSIFIRSVCPTQKWLISWIPSTSKGKTYFSLQWITR